MAKPAGRIPTLDGLRAVAIGFVLISHTARFGHSTTARIIELFGELGVRVFFVLSGFLITTLLIREHGKTGRIDLRAFFVRRVFRIFPAFFTFLAVMGVLAVTDVLPIPGRDFVFAATYTMNFVTPDPWYLGHAWSLAVEEQFYLLWPVTVVVVGIARAERVAIAAIIVAPILRVAAEIWMPWIDDIADHAFPLVFDGLALGCLLALARTRLEASPRYLAALRAWWFWLVPIAGLAVLVITLAHVGPLGNPRYFAVARSISAITIAAVVHRCVLTPTSLLGRFLETAPLVWVGTLSYSLYLWQQPFSNHVVHAWYTTFPLSWGFALAAACGSYYLVERPILRWRARVVTRTLAEARGPRPEAR